MKKAAFLLAMVLGLGVIFSPACKKNNSTTPIVDTINNTIGLPSPCTFKVFVTYQQTTGPKIVGADIFLFSSKAARDLATMHANTRTAEYHQQTFAQSDGNYAAFNLPVALAKAGGTTYWIWASDNYTGTGTLIFGIDSMVMPSPCNTCGYYTIVACQ